MWLVSPNLKMNRRRSFRVDFTALSPRRNARSLGTGVTQDQFLQRSLLFRRLGVGSKFREIRLPLPVVRCPIGFENRRHRSHGLREDKVYRALPTARTDDPTHVKDFIDWRCSLRYDDFADIDIGNSFARRDFPAVENRRIDRGIKVRLQSSNL